MDKLTSELRRLYLIGDQLVDASGRTRTLTIDFNKADGEEHWARLCDVANALQTELRLPAPAVSVSGGECYRLWLSLATPIGAEQAKQFLALLHMTYFADEAIDLGRGSAGIELPPAQNKATGLWAAFVNPSMGGALAEDLGLEMQPPSTAQAAFLEGLHSIGDEEFADALTKLQRKHDAVPGSASAVPPGATADLPDGAPAQHRSGTRGTGGVLPPDLLLKDATLEDIVRHLHAMNIEPTFRHLLKN